MKTILTFVLLSSSVFAGVFPELGKRIPQERLPAVKEALLMGLGFLPSSQCAVTVNGQKDSVELKDIATFTPATNTESSSAFFEGSSQQPALVYLYVEKKSEKEKVFMYNFYSDESGQQVTDVNWEFYEITRKRVNVGTMRNPSFQIKEEALKVAFGNCFKNL